MSVDYTKTSSRRSDAPAVTPQKVTLTKGSPKVSLAKQSGHLRVNLNWTARPSVGRESGLLKRLGGNRGIDLDLGCLYELADGSKGVVQALGNSFGSLNAPPYILLSGDDRTGRDVGGEDLSINLAHTGQLRRVLVFACIYEGAPSFDQAHGVVTLTPASGTPIEVRLDEAAGRSRMCAIALLESVGGELTVHREVRYIQGGQDALDREYGWGMQWRAGRK